MAFLPQVFTIATMVTGATQTPGYQIPGSWLYVYVQVPTMTGYSADTPIYVRGSADGITYFRFVNTETNTNTVGANDFQIVSATSQRLICISNFAFRYIILETSSVATNAIASFSPFKIITVSNQ